MAALKEAVSRQSEFIGNLLPVSREGSKLPVAADFIKFYNESVKLFSTHEAIAAACEDAIGTEVPEEYDKDVESVLDAGSLEQFISMIHEANDAHSFNYARAFKLFGHLPEDVITARHKTLVLQIAEYGSPYCLPASFQPYSVIQDLRNKTLQLGLCQLKHAIKLRKKGKCLLLKISSLPPGFLELCGIDVRGMAHWTMKFAPDGSLLPEGRFLLDLNCDPSGAEESLNSDAAKEASASFYGPLHYPNIVDFIRDVYNYCKLHDYALSDIRFFVEDNKGAFTTHKKDPQSCRFVCIRVSLDYLMLPIYGMFGHHAEPAVWEQPASALDAVIRQHIHGVFRRYVDDRFNAAHFSMVASDHDVVRSLNDECYAPNSLDAEKSQADNFEITAIGWILNSLLGTIRPSEKAVRKIAVAFFSIPTHAKASWSLKQVQMLASLAERYSLCIVGMRPFVAPFNRLLRTAHAVHGGRRNHASRRPDSAARFAVMMWRSVAVTLFADPHLLSIPMFSLLREVHDSPSFFPVTDAANKIGMIIYDKSHSVVSWVSFRFPFSAPDADYQNAKEFLGIISVFVSLKLCHNAPRGTCVSWTTDSMTALSWLHKNKQSSAYGQFAFAAFSWIVVRSGYMVPEYQHAAGISDTIQPVDDLSRDANIGAQDPRLQFAFDIYPDVVELFRLLDPTQVHTLLDPESILAVFTRVSHLISRIFV